MTRDDNSTWTEQSRAVDRRHSTLKESMDAWDQLPAWARRQNMYASFDVSAPQDLETYRHGKKLCLSKSTLERLFMKGLLKAEADLAREIGRPVMGRRDAPIAEWSGHRNRIPFDHMRRRRIRR